MTLSNSPEPNEPSVPSWYSDPSAPSWSNDIADPTAVAPAPSAPTPLSSFELPPLPWDLPASSAPAEPVAPVAAVVPEPVVVEPVVVSVPVVEAVVPVVSDEPEITFEAAPPTISFEAPAEAPSVPVEVSPFGEYAASPFGAFAATPSAPAAAAPSAPAYDTPAPSAGATALAYSPAVVSEPEHGPTLTAVPSTPSAWDNPKRDLDLLLTELVEKGGSDLHLTAGIAPCMRIDGSLAPMPERTRLLPDDTLRIARSMLSDAQWEKFERTQELDTSYTIPGVSRYRVNVFRQRSSVGMVFRSIPHHIRSLSELGMPDSVEDLARLPRGLVLVTGPTGSGKSTTLASLLDVANRTRSGHIVTIEDPIEYLHQHKKCVVNQREIGSDTEDFNVALKHVLRQDPDIILVGELRDLETTSVAVTAAETGHLVLATLHTQSAAQTIDRLIDIYPADQQQQIRAQLSNCLQAVVTQALAPRKDSGRAVVCEIMLATPAIRNLIREGKVHQIPSFLQSSRDLGMISFDQHLAERYSAQMISKGVALDLCHDENEFRRLARI